MTLHAVLLAALLVLGAVGTTLARAHAASLSAVELCGIHGIKTVLLDASGNPADPPPACPDCIAAVAALPDAAPATAAPLRLARAAAPLRAGVGPVGAGVRLPPARGPPPLV